MLERTLVAWPFRREERQLPAQRVRADQRERVLPVDDVHTEVPRGEGHDGLPVRHPEGDVVQGLGLHAARLASRYFLASTARWSWALLMLERPGTLRRLASL